MKPLITLCMMVKDEAHTIARTLRSAKPWIDRWCIVDTGSTDGTPEIIESEMRDGDDATPGHLYHRAFVDFAHTRNVLLDLAKDDAGFLLLLDADDVLEGGETLRVALEYQRSVMCTNTDPQCCICREREAFYVRMRQGSTVWDSARVVRASAVNTWPEPEEHEQYCDGYACAKCNWKPGWRYVGAVHEVLTKEGAPPPSIRIPGVTITHDPPSASAERSRARWERDLVLLARELDADSANTRAAFYYAKTLRQLGRDGAALAAFERRIALGGWREEVYDSAFERAKLLPTIEERVLGMLEAHALDPRRAEPLAAAAFMLLTASGAKAPMWGPAYALAKRAWEMPEPAGALFVDVGVYTWWAADLVSWAASHVGEWTIGERAARQALEHGPEDHQERLAANVEFYEKRRASWGR